MSEWYVWQGSFHEDTKRDRNFAETPIPCNLYIANGLQKSFKNTSCKAVWGVWWFGYRTWKLGVCLGVPLARESLLSAGGTVDGGLPTPAMTFITL